MKNTRESSFLHLLIRREITCVVPAGNNEPDHLCNTCLNMCCCIQNCFVPFDQSHCQLINSCSLPGVAKCSATHEGGHLCLVVQHGESETSETDKRLVNAPRGLLVPTGTSWTGNGYLCYSDPFIVVQPRSTCSTRSTRAGLAVPSTC
jgi:hypothetical protein